MLRLWLLILIQFSFAVVASAQQNSPARAGILLVPELVSDPTIGALQIPFSCYDESGHRLQFISMRGDPYTMLITMAKSDADGGQVVINSARLLRLPPWTTVFALLRECEYYINGESMDPNGRTDGEADKAAIRWIRDNEPRMPPLLHDYRCGDLSPQFRASCAVGAISDSILGAELDNDGYARHTARVAYIRRCFASENDSCTPADHSANTDTPESDGPEVTQLRSDEAVMVAQSSLQRYVLWDESAYKQGKRDLGIEGYSISAGQSARIVRVKHSLRGLLNNSVF